MTSSWSVTDSMGNMHQITFVKSAFGGKAKCIVDGDTYKMKSKNWVIWMADHQISIPGAECNLVVLGNKVRLAVNGTYLDDGTPYEPIRNIPAWVHVLVAIDVFGGYFLCGIFGFAIGVVASLLGYKMILNKKTGPAVAILVVALVLEVILMFVVGSLLAGV